jgi:hypothetical protein
MNRDMKRCKNCRNLWYGCEKNVDFNGFKYKYGCHMDDHPSLSWRDFIDGEVPENCPYYLEYVIDDNAQKEK